MRSGFRSGWGRRAVQHPDHRLLGGHDGCCRRHAARCVRLRARRCFDRRALRAGVASAAPARQDSVSVTGSAGFFTNVEIAATSGPNGENPTGRVSLSVPGLLEVTDAPISCLNVTGRFASIGVPLPASSFGGVVLTVADNGAAGSGVDTVDFVSLGTVPATCPEPFGGLGLLTGGDAVVSDAGSRPGLGCGDKNHVHAGSFFCEQKRLVKGLKEDSVTATGDFSGFDDVALDVRSGPNGEHPTASVAFTFLGERFEAASITCIAVRGGAATIGGTVKPNA